MRLTSRIVTIGLVAVGVFIGAGVTGVYARRKIHQFDRYCTDVPCMHYDARMSGIRSVIGQRDRRQHHRVGGSAAHLRTQAVERRDRLGDDDDVR